MRVELNLERHPLTIEVGWFFGYLGNVQVVYMDGRVDDPSYARYVDAVRTDIDDRRARGEQTPVFYHIPQPSALTAHRRALLAKVLKEKEAELAQHTAAYAMVTHLVDGALRLARSVLVGAAALLQCSVGDPEGRLRVSCPLRCIPRSTAH